MGATIILKENETGRVVEYWDEIFDDEIGEFMWLEGNFACDCNRALCFARALGEPDPEPIPCSMSKYTAIKAILDDGTEMMLDDES